MRIPWYAKAGVVAGTGFAAIFLAAPSAFAAVALTRLSTDTFTNSTSAHATQVEPDTYAFGSTIVMAAQTGRFTIPFAGEAVAGCQPGPQGQLRNRRDSLLGLSRYRDNV